MTAQDADEGDSEPVEATDDVSEQDGVGENWPGGDDEIAVDPDSIEEFLSELAEVPDEAVDDVLADIIAGDESEADVDDVAVGFDTPIDPTEITVGEDLLDELADTSTDRLARTLAVLRAEVDRLETRLEALEERKAESEARADDLEDRLARKQADFQNFKKRQQKLLEDEKQRATEDLVSRLLDVRDNLERALEQDDGTDIRPGVESTLDQFDQQLDRENVARIEPEEGDETDPRRHEVLATIASDQPEDTIAQVHRPGYEMGEKVLRPAQVAVSDGSLVDDGEKAEPETDENS